MSDDDLDAYWPAIVSGQPEVFGLWMAQAEPSLRRGLIGFAEGVDTEAVLQEALLRVWQVAPRFEPDGRPNGLLRLASRIARNLAISELRRVHATPMDAESLERAAIGLSDQPELEAAGLPDPFLRRAIEECRERLPLKPKLALAARIDGDGTESDPVLAERLGMRPNTFLQNFGRARKLLAECLDSKGVKLELA